MNGNWISVEEKLPKFDEPVLIADQDVEDSVEKARLYSYTDYHDKTGVTRSYTWLLGNCSVDDYIHNVTHWQPLPVIVKGAN